MSHHFIRKEHKTSEVLTDTKWFNKCPTLGWVHLCRWQKKRIMVQLLQPVQYAVFRFNVSYNGFVQLCNDQGTRPAALYNNANANSLHGVWIWHSREQRHSGSTLTGCCRTHFCISAEWQVVPYKGKVSKTNPCYRHTFFIGTPIEISINFKFLQHIIIF